VGSVILSDLIARARALGHQVIVAGISADQEASIRFHARFGFVEVGRLARVGNKFDRWLDLVFMQREI
jgi:phosphinothricin acetyltransferase